jgi:peroxiredoxin Q/BCP
VLKPGDKARKFCLPDKDGKKTCLSDFEGKWVVLYFYPKDDTSGCTMEATYFSKDKAQFTKLGAVILAASPDSPDSHCKFADKHALTITLLSDPQHKVLGTYGAWHKKSMYGREFWGVVRSTFLIDPKGKIGHVWPKVKVAGHVEEVRKKLIELSGESRRLQE